MTKINMAPDENKPAISPSPQEKDKQPAAKPDEVTSPSEVKKQ